MPESPAPATADLRSDTLTQPTPAMRKAMAEAAVGDDVFGEDPSVNQLEEHVARLLGKEAALLVPSGTMGNQIGVRLHCGPGDEFLCESDCHIFNYEQGAFAQLFGIAVQPVPGEYGLLRPEQLVDCIRPPSDHQVRTRLICLENTHNRGAGRVLPYHDVEQICAWAASAGLARHLDGARLWNAVAATGIPASDWARHFDTVSVCFSKSLGAPVGSALCGSGEQIARARRLRKALGGAMRQAGILAAGALYAVEHHMQRLSEDQDHAQLLADAVRQTPGLELATPTIDTNIVIFHVDELIAPADVFCERLREEGVLMMPVARHKVRAVTHLDVSRQQVEQACEVLNQLALSSMSAIHQVPRFPDRS